MLKGKISITGGKVFRWTRQVTAALLAALMFYSDAGQIRSSRAELPAAEDELIRVPYVEEELICVNVKLLGQQALFAIDTGCSMSYVDKCFENQLNHRHRLWNKGGLAA